MISGAPSVILWMGCRSVMIWSIKKVYAVRLSDFPHLYRLLFPPPPSFYFSRFLLFVRIAWRQGWMRTNNTMAAYVDFHAKV
jgi:hypothetical protein